MQFTTVVLALAASASAAVLPRSPLGSWKVNIEQLDPNGSFFTHAVYTSDAYPEGLKTNCVLDTSETPVLNGCDKLGVTADWDGKTLKLSQAIEKPYPATVFGEAEFTLVPHEFIAKHVAEGTVEVQKAIA